MKDLYIVVRTVQGLFLMYVHRKIKQKPFGQPLKPMVSASSHGMLVENSSIEYTLRSIRELVVCQKLVFASYMQSDILKESVN